MTYAESYAFVCRYLIADVERRLGRTLTPDEQRRIWNVGSLMMLEPVEWDFDLKTTPEQIEQFLMELAGWTQRRFDDYCQSALTQLQTWLGQDLTEAEGAALLRSEHIGVVMEWCDRIHAAVPNECEALLQEWLGVSRLCTVRRRDRRRTPSAASLASRCA
jgi:hypothetical protein